MKALQRIWYDFISGSLAILCKVLFRLRQLGRQNIPAQGAFIIASNHQSYLDPVLCGAPLRQRLTYMARESLFQSWFFGPAIRSVNAIPLKQGEGDLATVRAVIKLLKEGKGVCLFPEGTRTEDGKITPFKPGLGLLCRKGNAPIIPTVIDGAFECWPRSKKMFSCGSIWVQFGQPISAERAKEMGDKKLAQHLTDTLRQMQHEIREKRGKQPYQY